MVERREDPAVAYARELEQQDEALGRAIAAVDELQRESGLVHARAVELSAFLDRLPSELAQAEDSVRSAELELARRTEELREAEAELAGAEGRAGEEELAAARRAVVRGRDAAATSERRLGRARATRAGLEQEREHAGEETRGLERKARELARRLAEEPRAGRRSGEAPAPGLAGILAWAARAEAALFVVRGGLDAERERVVRQANELGASELGEPLAATSVALVRERLEQR